MSVMTTTEKAGYDALVSGAAQALKKDGSVALTADQPMGAHALTGLRATAAAGESVRYEDIVAQYTVDFREDWVNGDVTGTQKWVNVVAGTGTVTSSTNGVSDMHPGVLVLSRGTTAVSRAGTFQGTTAAAWVLGTNGTLYQHWCFRIATLSDGTNTFLCYLGHGDTPAAGAQVNGVTIVIDTTTDSHIGLQARSSSAGAVSFGTFVVPANTWINARIKKSDGSTTFGLEVLIAGVWTDQGISISTNIPTTQVDVLAKLDGTVGTANRTLEIDFVHQRVVFPNGRT